MNQSGALVYSFLPLPTSKKLWKKPIQLIKKKKKGYTTTIAGGSQGTNDGQGTLAQFYSPLCVSMDSIGNLYVGDYCAIRMISSTGL